MNLSVQAILFYLIAQTRVQRTFFACKLIIFLFSHTFSLTAKLKSSCCTFTNRSHQTENNFRHSFLITIRIKIRLNQRNQTETDLNIEILLKIDEQSRDYQHVRLVLRSSPVISAINDCNNVNVVTNTPMATYNIPMEIEMMFSHEFIQFCST